MRSLPRLSSCEVIACGLIRDSHGQATTAARLDPRRSGHSHQRRPATDRFVALASYSLDAGLTDSSLQPAFLISYPLRTSHYRSCWTHPCACRSPRNFCRMLARASVKLRWSSASVSGAAKRGWKARQYQRLEGKSTSRMILVSGFLSCIVSALTPSFCRSRHRLAQVNTRPCRNTFSRPLAHGRRWSLGHLLLPRDTRPRRPCHRHCRACTSRRRGSQRHEGGSASALLTAHDPVELMGTVRRSTFLDSNTSERKSSGKTRSLSASQCILNPRQQRMLVGTFLSIGAFSLVFSLPASRRPDSRCSSLYHDPHIHHICRCQLLHCHRSFATIQVPTRSLLPPHRALLVVSAPTRAPFPL